jgi:formylglycine-generating enzyme
MNAAPVHGSARRLAALVWFGAAISACSSDFEGSDEVGSSSAGSGATAATGGGGGNVTSDGGSVASGGAFGSGTGGAATAGSSSAGASTGGNVSAGGGGGTPEPELEACPETKGSPMVRVAAEAGGFCIDAHETTRAEYAAFLENVEELAPQPSYCAWNLSYAPTEGTNDDVDLPVVGVDFCDARAFCDWAGKRLCGKIGGGPTEYDAYASASESQWYAACSHGGTRVFPYGNSYDGALCNGADDNHEGKAMAADSQCEGGYEGIFDMSGNVWEWEDACDGELGIEDDCRLRGGEFSNPEGFLRCDYGEFSITRNFATSSIGIRCCGP